MSKKFLVLGAGMVSAPCVEYLLRQEYSVTVGCAIEEELERLSSQYPSASSVQLDVTHEKAKTQDLISQHDVIISLLPTYLHTEVAKSCIDCKKSLVTASYEDDSLRALNSSAVAAGITILSECGLDPGIDHMLAMSCIDSIKQEKGKIDGYISLCGGLPAPECSHGPLRYKFSWSPMQMFLSLMAPARYLKDGQLVDVAPGHILDNPEIVSNLVEGAEMEDLPNRDSLGYKDIYDIQSANTVYRGTLRYKGFSSQMQALISLGLLRKDSLPDLDGTATITWRNLMCKLLGLPEGSSVEKLKSSITAESGKCKDQLDTIQSLGLLSDEEVPMSHSLLEALCAHLSKRLAYGHDERDMVVMRSVVESTTTTGKKQLHTFDLVEKGQIGGHSAMARTVGLTVAICASLIAEGAVSKKGTILPTSPDIYQPVLQHLILKEGVNIKSTVTSSVGS